MAQPSKSSRGTTKRSSFRFSDRTNRLLGILAVKDALNKTAWLETTITRIARERGIDVDSMREPRQSNGEKEAGDGEV